jgi:hypothetical protein
MIEDREFHDSTLPEPITDGVFLERFGNNVSTNVPHLVVHHSPTGFEWGYGGSGPADLALNIVEVILNEIGYIGERVDCWKGDCWADSWKLHQQFKFEFIAPMDRAGGKISYPRMKTWIEYRLGKNGTRRLYKDQEND